VSPEVSVLSQKTDVPQVVVLPVDPLNGPTAMLLPFIAQRIFNMAQERMQELDPERFTRVLMANLWGANPGLLVLALLEPSGKLVGHVTAEYGTDGVKKWIYCAQCKADGNVGDAVRRALQMIEAWAESLVNVQPAGVPVTRLTMATHRDDDAWRRKYGFEKDRSVCSRVVGSPIGSSAQ